MFGRSVDRDLVIATAVTATTIIAGRQLIGWKRKPPRSFVRSLVLWSLDSIFELVSPLPYRCHHLHFLLVLSFFLLPSSSLVFHLRLSFSFRYMRRPPPFTPPSSFFQFHPCAGRTVWSCHDGVGGRRKGTASLPLRCAMGSPVLIGTLTTQCEKREL